MFDLVELGEAGVRAFAFWLYLFNSTYRAQIHRQWREAGRGARAVLLFEYLISVVLGVGGPVLVWRLLA
jgi:hypothetical protein